jgi:hypothetical protein
MILLARSGTPSQIERLIDRVEEAAADPRYARRKEMWTRHNRLERASKAPVCVFLPSGGYPLIWQELIPPDTLVAHDPLARSIELQLRQKLYKHDHIPDDEVLLPTIWVSAVRPAASEPEGDGAARLWGLPFRRHQVDRLSGTYKVDPVVTSAADLARLSHPRYEVDAVATRVRCERATEMVGGRLPVKVATDELAASPSETVVSLMGIDAVLYGVLDCPDLIHQMMEFVTDGYIAYHLQREAAGGIDPEASWKSRVHYEALPPDADPRRLRYSWAYIAAQSLCGLSPAMYAEFVQPYHARLAAVLGHNRVYYHGCEDLTAKISIIRQLPNLRRFHISPWTNLESAVAQLGRSMVLETHVHPGDTLLGHTPDQMRAALERIMRLAGHCVLDINLSDIHTTGRNPAVLTTWAQTAQEVTARFT